MPETAGFEVSSVLLGSSDFPVWSLGFVETGTRELFGFEKERAEGLVAGFTCEDLIVLVRLDTLVEFSRGADL